MVRAILDGRKTMTRRVLKPQPSDSTMQWLTDAEDRKAGGWQWLAEQKMTRWRPDDALWVREAWQYYDWTEDGQPWVRYRADDASLLRNPPEESMPGVLDQWITLSDPENMAIDGRARDRKWRPSIYMPRWASRITLLVTDVRIERLQDISEADACAEGVWTSAVAKESGELNRSRFGGQVYHYQPFKELWTHLHGHDAWDANPWVSVTKFKRVAE